jgi:hypothetical protein
MEAMLQQLPEESREHAEIQVAHWLNAVGWAGRQAED